MAMLIADPWIEEALKEQRRAWGADHHDEAWEGVYFMSPFANDEHQQIVTRLAFIFEAIVGLPGLAEVRAGVNLAGFEEDWKRDYRVPDVVVFMHGGSAENCGPCWRGAADFLVEVTSPDDRTYEKLPFYARLGVRELLIVNRHPWAVELYRLRGSKLEKVGESTLQRADWVTSAVVPLRFQLFSGAPRPTIEVIHTQTGQRWMV